MSYTITVGGQYGLPRPGSITGKHEGEDRKYLGSRIDIPNDQLIRVIHFGVDKGVDIHGNSISDWSFIAEGQSFYHWWYHLSPNQLVGSLELVYERGFVAYHTENHPAFGTHAHYGVAYKNGAFKSVSDAERRGWTFNPSRLGVEVMSIEDCRVEAYKIVCYLAELPEPNQQALDGVRQRLRSGDPIETIILDTVGKDRKSKLPQKLFEWRGHFDYD